MGSATPLVRPRGNAGTGQLVALQDMDAIVLGSALSNGIRDSKTTHSYMVI